MIYVLTILDDQLEAGLKIYEMTDCFEGWANFDGMTDAADWHRQAIIRRCSDYAKPAAVLILVASLLLPGHSFFTMKMAFDTKTARGKNALNS